MNWRPQRSLVSVLSLLSLAGLLGSAQPARSADDSSPPPDKVTHPRRPNFLTGGPDSPPPTPFRLRPGENPSEPTGASPLAIRPLGPGVFLLGGMVRLDAGKREVSFPALLNMTNGPMEYLLVHSEGKTHESILRTDAKPSLIQMAMLLLGVKSPVETNEVAGTAANLDSASPKTISNPSPEDLKGEKVQIFVRWEADGAEQRRAAGDLLLNRNNPESSIRANWVYNGSRIEQGHFLADMEGSIISLVTDPFALMNSSAPGHGDDEIWRAKTSQLPPAGVPLEIVIGLEAAPKGAPADAAPAK